MERILLVILFGACVLLPVSPAIANIFLLVFGGGIVIKSCVEKKFPTKREWASLLILPSFFFLCALSAAFFSLSKESFRMVEKFIPFMVLSLAYIFAAKSIKTKAPSYISNGIVFGVMGSILYLLVLMVIRFVNADEESILNVFSHRYTYGNFTDPIGTHPTYYTIWLLAANFFVFNSKKLNIYWKITFLGILSLALIFTMSRVGLGLYGLQILALFFYLPKKGKILYTMGMTLVLVVGIYLYNNQLRHFYLLQRFSLELSWDINAENTGSEINNRVADDSRIARWTAIWETIKEKPILGYGAGSEDSVLETTYRKNNLDVSLERMYNTHNQYLFYLLEHGFFGLILFCGFFIVNCITALKRKDLFMLSFIIGILIVFMFENYMYRSMGYLTMALFLTFMRNSQK